MYVLCVWMGSGGGYVFSTFLSSNTSFICSRSTCIDFMYSLYLRCLGNPQIFPPFLQRGTTVVIVSFPGQQKPYKRNALS